MKSIFFAFGVLLTAFSSNCQTFPDRFSRVQVASGLTNPTAMAFAPDGRIFVCEQVGDLRVIKNGTLLSTPFVQLNVDPNGERGLLGIALDPNFTANGFIYLYYTVPNAPVHNRVSRFTANGDVALAGSEQIILELDNLSSAQNHNGGSLAFGPDGKLYVAVGENGCGSCSQDPNMHKGKILRMNSDGSVPAGNPFASGSEQIKRVWALGLRNPFTFSFQPGTGRFFVNDVGENTKEEINDATLGGHNFGWPTAEGNSANPAFTNPIFTYNHGIGDGIGCAITGGTFFNPTSTSYPSSYTGKYFFLDLCSDWINYIDISGANAVRFPFANNIGGTCLALQVGIDGNLYYLNRGDQKLYKIVYDNTGAPQIQAQPSNLVVGLGQPASFSVTATGTPAVTYQWQKNNADIPGATQSSFTISTTQAADGGSYRVIVSNVVNIVTSNTVTLGILPPLGVDEINGLRVYPSPALDRLYIQSGTVSVEGVRLFDNLCKMTKAVLQEPVSGALLAVDVSSLSGGLYFLIITTSAGEVIRKVMIQR